MQTACWRSLVQSQERRKHSKGVGASAGESAACPPAYCCVLASLERWFCTRLCSSNDAYELAACKPVCHACSDSTFGSTNSDSASIAYSNGNWYGSAD
ncbi:hypothetical protein GQ600_24572 [Phytophthora cactorum]|nr:hypothetical protein GQ600_24572 [Phytophthora cactorum]